MNKNTTDSGPGSTRVRKKALVSMSHAVAAQELGVPSDHVQSSIFDDAGKLGVDINLDYPLGPIHDAKALAQGTHGQGTIFDLLAQARARIARQLTQLCGSEVGSINIALDGTTSPSSDKARVQ
ncbi:hypothetical protein ACN082_00535 [Rothia sp. CCM 9417]|uniref:hypothetical protein n=1 Tax=unclassified Rothia (in: high G+C Gram-positive bacteria) TaxID=2689056 RepID=UPI003ACCCD70